MALAPSATVIAAFLASTSFHSRRIDIYEADGTTLWMADAPLSTGGSISVDATRDERRSFNLNFSNTDGALSYSPDGFWYDKIIKAYRGIYYTDPTTLDETYWETQVGEFLIDKIKEPHFPNIVAVDGRDYTKKMLSSKFVATTTLSKGMPLSEAISSLAANAGIAANKRVIPYTQDTLGKDFTWDRGVSRWEAAKALASNYGYDLFFNAEGYLIIQPTQDPASSPVSHTLQTGAAGNLTSYDKSVNDSRLYNHIVVAGESSETVPVWAEARNDAIGSPTSIGKIGDRLYQYVSSFITTVEQAQAVADKFLAIHSLQEFELNFGSLVFPWLEVGEIIQFIDPKPYQTQPDRFLLSSMTIPLDLAIMTGTGKRVTIL